MGWHARGLLPTPDAELASGPIWWCSTIQQWEAPRHHDLTGGMQGPSPKWLDNYTSIRETRGDPPAEVAAWRKEVIAKYPTLQAHRLEREPPTGDAPAVGCSHARSDCDVASSATETSKIRFSLCRGCRRFCRRRLPRGGSR